MNYRVSQNFQSWIDSVSVLKLILHWIGLSLPYFKIYLNTP